MVRTSLAVALALPALVCGTASQLDYPACAVNHAPEYFCCDLGAPEGSDVSNGLVYTRYNKPQGAGYSSYYDEGWLKSRQVNYDPDGDVSLYAPSTPSYVYGQADKTCRLHDVAVDGAVVSTLQCTFAPSSDDAIYTQNASLAEDSTDTSVFWTATPNPRNNNASLPIGAVCTSLMLDDGSVNATAQSLCVSASSASIYRFNSFTETPLVVVYAIYGFCFLSLACWAALRSVRGVHHSSDEAAPLTTIVDGSKKLLDHRGGPETPGIKTSTTRPSLADRPSEVQLRHSTEDIVQTGYTDSHVGYAVFAYFVLMTVLLNVPIILTIRDNQGKLATDTYAAWFNPTTVVIKVFISLWVIATFWFVVVVVYRFKILNFFRYPTALDKCTRVLMYKPEVTETMLADRSGVAQMVLKVESFIFPHSRQGVEETVTVHTTAEGARYLEFQHLRYTFDDVEDKFVPGSVVLPDSYDKILSDSQGLTSNEYARRLDIVGRNAIEVEMPSWATSVVDEFFSFFYIYQLMCYYVWYFTDYVWVSVLNTVVIVLAAAFNIYAKRSMLSSVVQMTHYVAEVTVKRDGQWLTIKSSDLAPGDLVRVAENWELPCDLVIVKGSTVCDESMLTGESMPVQKFPLPNDSNDVYDAEGNGKKYTLFSGTRTLASGRDEEILAIVQATGAHTSRGQLVQAILYPAPIRFKYDEHLKAVFSVLFIIGLIAAYFAMKFLIENAGLSNTLFAFVYGMFMFSAVLNPLLPVVMTVGQVNAAKRLQKQDVFCLNTQRITLCGKVRVFCFDKTGTITKEGLDYRGCVPIGDSGEFLSEFNDMTDASLNQTMKFSLASCHAVGSLNGELVGNEVEVKMFKSTQWKLIESEGQLPVVQSADGSEELEFVKRFEFDHHRMSMSVVMKQRSTGKLIVFCKGSYEKMESVSSKASIPANYFETAENLAKNGCYVLGIAYKEMPAMSESDLTAFLADRDAVEESLALLGLIMFRNEIKEDSRDAILTLKQGDIRSVMITGDNAMTGCYIARASGMVEEDSQMVLGDMVTDEKTGSMLVWKDVETQQVFSFDDIRDMMESVDTKVELAVTGKAFDFLVKMGDIKKILLKTRIFSRMTPQGKVDCVKLHMGTGSVTGMCGDGGNDCGALRIAHVGVALSDAEASVVSPFTSKSRTLKSVVDLVLEGRGALATSFASVKYLIMYGLIGIGCRTVMYYNGVFISQFGFMYLDGAILVGISYGLTRARPLQAMGPQRPTSSLVGPTTVCSLVGAAAIHWLFLYGAIHDLTTQPWYCPFQPSNVNLVQWWLLQDSNLGSTLWFIICFQQMSTGLTMGLGSRFRRPIWHNMFLLFWYALLIVVLVVTFVGPPSRFGDQFRVASSTNVVGLPDIPLPSGFRWELFGWGIADTAAVLIYEYFFVLGYVRDFFRAKYHRDALPMKLLSDVNSFRDKREFICKAKLGICKNGELTFPVNSIMKTRPAEPLFVQRGPVIAEPSASVWQKAAQAFAEIEQFRSNSVELFTSSSQPEGLFNVAALRRRSVVVIRLKYVTFKDAFGVLGIPMVVVALVCVSWTIWLIVLTLAPNETANFLMGTSEYDDGQFWLIPEEVKALQVASVAGLAVVVILYVFVLLKILVWREYNHVEGSFLDRILRRCAPNRTEFNDWSKLDFRHRVYRLIWELCVFVKELTGFHGRHRKLWNLCLKALDLVMQSLLLSELLESGTPVHLTFGYAVFTALNSLFCAVEIISHRYTAFAEILIDSLFDLCTAVLFPIVVLVYSADNFDFDRAVYQINVEELPVGSFERRARMFANPTEIALFRVSFDSLRIRTMSDFVLRIGMNIGFSYRFKRVVEVLIQMQSQRQQQQGKRKESLGQKQSMLLQSPKTASGLRSCQRAVPKSAAILFITYSIGVVVVTQQSVSTSQKACSSHPECVVFAYRWYDPELCPCLALIDGIRAPKTYYEWTHPVDAINAVKDLAAAGTLEMIQLINRQLMVLPDELRGCHNLNFISLINCAIEELPTWAKDFRKLQYLQIEGKVGSKNLGDLADDLFSDMPKLRYLQFGLHQRMTRLPSLNGVPNLSCIVLARMGEFTALPPFEHLPRLQRLEFSVMKDLSRIPDLALAGKIVHFAVYQGAYLCCNRFLGTCDLTNPFCSDTTCLDDPTLLATQATLKVFEEFSASVCQPYTGLSQTPTAETIQMCDGVMFRQCRLPGSKPNTSVVGICYSHRMQIIACNPDPAKIRVRRRQIEEGVGIPCNPLEESWLGCNRSTA